MTALDTNVLVRFLVRDHEAQFERARRLIKREVGAQEKVLISLLVLLETEWVLRSVYGYGASQLVKALRAFAGLPHVTTEDAGLMAQALDWMEGGMDFADALHLVGAQGCDAFVSFDRRFARLANRLSAVKGLPAFLGSSR